MKILMLAVDVEDKRPLKSESGKNLLQRGKFLCFCFFAGQREVGEQFVTRGEILPGGCGTGCKKVDLLFSINMICCFLSI